MVHFGWKVDRTVPFFFLSLFPGSLFSFFFFCTLLRGDWGWSLGDSRLPCGFVPAITIPNKCEWIIVFLMSSAYYHVQENHRLGICEGHERSDTWRIDRLRHIFSAPDFGIKFYPRTGERPCAIHTTYCTGVMHSSPMSWHVEQVVRGWLNRSEPITSRQLILVNIRRHIE